MPMFRLFSATLAAALVAASAAPALADTSTGTIGVSLRVTNACVINGASAPQANAGVLGSIQFPDQPGLFGNVDGQLVGSLGTLQVQCSPNVAPVLTIGSGLNDAAGRRRLESSGNLVSYRLFSDAARTNEVGIGQQLPLGTMTSAAVSVPIYARVNSGGAILAAGTYTDTVQVTLTW